MVELKIVSQSKRQLKPIVEAALENELRLVEAGIRQTALRLKKFEEQSHLNTQAFITAYENDEWEETMESIEWIGEFRLMERLNEKAETLRNISFAS